MPPVDREAVKTLAIAIGPNEAARRLGLKPGTVRQWSARGKWFAPAPQKPNSALVTSVTSPSQALSNVLSDDSRETKLDLSAGFRNSAKAYRALPPEKALALVEKGRQTAQGAALVHSWEESKPQGTLSLEVITGETAIRVQH